MTATTTLTTVIALADGWCARQVIGDDDGDDGDDDSDDDDNDDDAGR